MRTDATGAGWGGVGCELAGGGAVARPVPELPDVPPEVVEGAGAGGGSLVSPLGCPPDAFGCPPEPVGRENGASPPPGPPGVTTLPASPGGAPGSQGRSIASAPPPTATTATTAAT